MHRAARKNGEIGYDPHLAKHMWIGPVVCFGYAWWQVGNLYYALLLNPILPMDNEDQLGSTSDGSVWLPYLYVVTTWVVLVSVCLLQASRTKPSPQPPIDSVTLNGARYLTVLERDKEGLDKNMAYCDDCKRHKPAYCHHCRWCKSCVLKFDHHCMALNNCVGMHNYKFFFLLLAHGTGAIIAISYALIASAHAGTIVAMCAREILSSVLGMEAPQAWNDMASRATRQPHGMEAFLLLMAVVTAMCMTLGLVIFTAFHTRLLLMQQTTLDYLIESKEAKSGCAVLCASGGRQRPTVFQRVSLVLGSSVLMWPFPILTSRDRYRQLQDAMIPFEIQPDRKSVV